MEVWLFFCRETNCGASGTAAQDQREAAFLRLGLRRQMDSLRVKMEMQTDWQNLSKGLSESVILAESGVTAEVTISQDAAENTEVWSRTTSDFRHLGLWPSECDSTCELVIQPNQSNGEKGKLMRKQKGFSLIELLIVVAIILIIAAIAIPNLLRARIAANESSAVSSIRTLNTAEVTYQSTYPTVGYTSLIAALGPAASTGCTTPASTNACLVDWVVAQASASGSAKSGFWFTETPLAAMAGGIIPGYTLSGIPASVNQSGVRGFCSNNDAVIRFTAVGNAQVTTQAACYAYTALQ